MDDNELIEKLYKLAEEHWPSDKGYTEKDKNLFIHGFVTGYGKARLAVLDITEEEIKEAALDYDNKTTYDPPHIHFTEGVLWHMEKIRTKH